MTGFLWLIFPTAGNLILFDKNLYPPLIILTLNILLFVRPFRLEKTRILIERILKSIYSSETHFLR